MEPFLRRFFPHVLRRMAAAKGNEYCLYDSQTLTAFTSSLYVAGLVASRVTGAMGRQAVMLMGGALFFTGGAMTGAAVNIAMLIVGSMLLGFGVGFTNQVGSRPPLHSCTHLFRSSSAAQFLFSTVRRAHVCAPANGPSLGWHKLSFFSLDSLDLAVALDSSAIGSPTARSQIFTSRTAD